MSHVIGLVAVVHFPYMWLACAGLVVTGGMDGIIKGWDIPQGGNRAGLTPAFTMNCPEVGIIGSCEEIDNIVSAASLGGEFSSQILTGA
jgi:hypothetical protein